MMASPGTTRRVVRRFRLAARFRPRALPARGSHVFLGPGSFARRLGFLGLAFRGPRLIHRSGRDPLRGFLWPTPLFEVRLDVVVLPLAFVAPSLLWHGGHLLDPRVQAACAVTRRSVLCRHR